MGWCAFSTLFPKADVHSMAVLFCEMPCHYLEDTGERQKGSVKKLFCCFHWTPSRPSCSVSCVCETV